jgi:hypothetical protein
MAWFGPQEDPPMRHALASHAPASSKMVTGYQTRLRMMKSFYPRQRQVSVLCGISWRPSK